MLKNVCLQKQKASSPTLFLPTLANYSENFLHITAKKITPKKVKTDSILEMVERASLKVRIALTHDRTSRKTKTNIIAN